MIIFLAAVLIYLGFGVYLYINQRKYIYYPPSETVPSKFPTMYVFSGFKRIRVTTINQGQPHAIIYFGGSAEQVNSNGPLFQSLFPHHSTYLVNYRGYGGSPGRPTEASLYKDALAVYDRIQTRHQTISVIGRSLGSGVATYVAANRPTNKLVLVTPFDSIEEVAQTMYPFYPISWMLIDKFDSLSRVLAIEAPTLILLSEQDRVVPHRHSLRLAQAFSPDQVSLMVIPHTNHINLNLSSAYGKALQTFLAPIRML
ncbi:hypothetical protein TI03_00655 [Achromatium sp. WMS1]|nr:hypothetical protein TI03_00655 [Achromatium sp. WMS1]